MADEKQVRKVAQCVRVLLETEGVKATARRISEVIDGEDLSDPVALKDKVKTALSTANDMRGSANDGPSTRQQRIETFMTQHWSHIRDDDVVRSALLDAYCKGRIKKDKRQEMQEELVKRCEAGVTPVTDAPISDDDESAEFDF